MAGIGSHSLGNSHESSEPHGPRFVLVMTVDSLAVQALPEQGHLIVGRSRVADVCLAEPAAAPRHLRLTARGGRLQVEDLGSASGTRVGGVPIPPRTPLALLPGEAIAIGSTVLMVREGLAQERPQKIWSHASFMVRVEEECERAWSGGTGFAVLRLAATGSPGQPLDVDWLLSKLAAAAPSPHAVGAYSDREFEVLLVGSEPAAALDWIDRLRASVGDRAGLAVAVAHCPADGRRADALVARANARLHPSLAAPWFPPAVAALIEDVAGHDGPLWLAGESGVGKKTVACAIHARSYRAAGPLQIVAAAGSSARELERTLFGDGQGEGGAWQATSGGTLVVTDIEELPRPLLYRLVVGPARPRIVGISRHVPSDVGRPGRSRPHVSRLIGAHVLVLPPLRDRGADLPALVAHLAAAAKGARGYAAPALGEASLRELCRQRWPGNFHELAIAVDRAVAGEVHTAADRCAEGPGAFAEVLVTRGELPTIADAERQRIVAALAACAFNQSRAAKHLGISRRTLLSRLDHFGIARPVKVSTAAR